MNWVMKVGSCVFFKNNGMSGVILENPCSTRPEHFCLELLLAVDATGFLPLVRCWR